MLRRKINGKTKMDMRVSPRNGWVATNNNDYSFLKNSKVCADIEHMSMYWRICYYWRNGDRVALQFEFEDADMPLVIVRQQVELKMQS